MLQHFLTTALLNLVDTQQILLLVCQRETKWKLTHSTSLRHHENRRMSSLSWQQPRRSKKETELLAVYLLTLNKSGSGQCRKENRLYYQQQRRNHARIMETDRFFTTSAVFHQRLLPLTKENESFAHQSKITMRLLKFKDPLTSTRRYNKRQGKQVWGINTCL